MSEIQDEMGAENKTSSHLSEIDVTENKQMAIVSTITQSIHEDIYKEIPRY